MRFLFLLGIVFILVPFAVSPALAMGDISYAGFKDTPATARLLSYLEREGYPQHLSALVGRVDLNEDNLDEFILRDCSHAPKTCIFSIWAERSKGYSKLGEISAVRVALGKNAQNGVRNLIAYPDPINDYNSVVYVWDAMNSRYIEE